MGVPQYLIVGGGLSGLITSYFISLTRPLGSYRLTVLESSNRWGGWIKSIKNADTGSIYEAGPHSARVQSPAGHLLLRTVMSLNLEQSILWMNRGTDAANRYIFINGQLIPLSAFTFSAVKPFTRSNFSLFISRLFSRRPPSQSDWTVDEFLRTRLGSEFADYLGSAMIRGIFAGDSRKLSARACLPMLVKSEEYGPNLVLGLLRSRFKRSSNSSSSIVIPSIINEKLPSLNNNRVSPNSIAWSLSGGMQTLIDTMVDNLNKHYPHIELHLNSTVEKLSLTNDSYEYRWRNVSCNNNDNKKIGRADAVFLCCPSFVTAEILEGLLTSDALKSLKLDHLPWEDVVSTVLEVEKSSVVSQVRGFGHLVPRTEDEHILGVIYDSIAFPQLDSVDGEKLRYTVMMKPYSDWLEQCQGNFNSTEDLHRKIEETSKSVLTSHLNIHDPVIVGRHVSVLRNCIPQYPVNHLDNITALRAEIKQTVSRNNSLRKGVYLVGNSYDGVGLSDAVFSAANAVAEELTCSS
ncbi:unnamed protein product [Trichobilharzia szidati]|nr:unnamed protein product [Trichobilharzia szidati]CAH8868421.1 unnamed protein product [Trichobilharzia szidati]